MNPWLRRLQVPGNRVGDGGHHTMVLVHEPDGAWTIHGLDTAGLGLRCEADVMVAACKAILERAERAGEPTTWYVRSAAERDTHRGGGGVHRDGCVVAVCGARFRPVLIHGRKALPGRPPDPAAVCPACREGV